jgi:pimeloyl-ACP methyl ester carboxylesterase
MLTPLSLLFGMFLGLLSVALPVIGAVLLWKAAHPPVRYVRELHRETVPGTQNGRSEMVDAGVRPLAWPERWREPGILSLLIVGALLLLLPLFGRPMVALAYPVGADEPRVLQGEVRTLTRPDGTKIHVEVFGPENAPTLVLSHGWGTSGTEWYYAKKQLAGKFRLIVWDLPGLGSTEQPADRDYSLDAMARDLHQVLTVADGRPVVLVGHSIGGMINLTFCRDYPSELGKQVRGVVEVDTSYTDPVRTASNSKLNEALQKPVGEPVLRLMIAASPVVRAANWMSYQEGLLYLNNARSSFAGTESRGMLDLVSRYQFESSPGVVARGTLGMFHWDATDELPKIHVPVLIIVGDKDTTTLPRASETMQSKISGARLQMVGPGRHYSLLERNSQVDEAIAGFAGGALPSPSQP